MSGLEILGAVAAAAQLCDICWRVTKNLSGLISDLEHVPRKLQTAIKQVNQLLDLSRMLKLDLDSLPTSILTDNSGLQRVAIVKNILEDCRHEAKELHFLCQSLVATGKDGKLKKTWRAVVSTFNEDRILELLDNLERQKSSLTVWYSHCNLFLLNAQGLSLRAAQQTIQSTHDNVTLLHAQTAAVKNSIQAATSAPFMLGESASVEIHSDRTLVRPHTSQIVTRIDPVDVGSAGTSKRSLSEVEIGALAQQICIRLVSKPEILVTAMRDLSTLDRCGDNALSQELVTSRKSLRCTCAPVPSSLERRGFKAATFAPFYNRQWRHRSKCPYSKSAERVYTVGFSSALNPLIAKAFSWSIAASFGAGSYSVTPSLTLRNVVRRDSSPAFALFNVVRERHFERVECDDRKKFPEGYIHSDIEKNDMCVWIWNAEGVADMLNGLVPQLDSLFASGKASATDTDERGETLLHAFTQLAIQLEYLQPRFAEKISNIVSYLLVCGVDKYASSTRGDIWTEVMGEITNRYDWEKRVNYFRIDKILLDNGCDDPYQDEPRMRFSPQIVHGDNMRWQLAMMRRFPNFAQDCGPLAIAIMHESEDKLRYHLRRGVHPDGGIPKTERYDFLVPLALARGWPTGREILLAAGADPWLAIPVAIDAEDIEVVTQLLDHDCPIFPPPEYDYEGHNYFEAPLIEFASGFGRFRSRLVKLVVKHLVDRRNRLRELATEHLSKPDQQRMQLFAEPMLDEAAQRVYEALRQRGVEVPAALRPGSRRAVYHYPDMGTDVADQLYEAGFRSLGVLDEQGYSPLVKHWIWNPDDGSKISWYFDKGASPILPFGCNWPSLFHVAEIGYFVLHRHPYQRKVIQYLNRVSDPLCRDSCDCWCSPSGCLPINVYSRHKPWYPESVFGQSCSLLGYVFLPYVTKTNQEILIAALCRTEMFERFGMAHICCKYQKEYPGHVLFIRKDSEERKELQEEDSYLHEQLETLMDAFDDLRRDSMLDIQRFWDEWWSVMDKHFPEIDYKKRNQPYARAYTSAKNDLDQTKLKEEESSNAEASTAEVPEIVAELKEHFASLNGVHDETTQSTESTRPISKYPFFTPSHPRRWR